MSPAENAAESLHGALVDAHDIAADLANAAGFFPADRELTAREYDALDEAHHLAEDALKHRYMMLVSVMQDRL